MNKITNKILVILVLSATILGANISSAKASFSDYVAFASISLNQANQSTDDSVTYGNSSTVGDQFLVPSSILSVQETKKNNAQTWSEEISVLATGYSSTPDQTDDSPFITAWGTHVRDGIIAANFYVNGKKIPFGTKVKIPAIYGNKVFVVEDRMNARYNNNIDIWFPTRSNALDFGAKRVKIQIVNS